MSENTGMLSDKIEEVRYLVALQKSLYLETRGKLDKEYSVYDLVKHKFGFKGYRPRVLAQLEELIVVKKKELQELKNET